MEPVENIEDDPWKTPEELLAHYMSLFEHFKVQYDKANAKLAIVTQERDEYKKKYEEAIAQGLPKMDRRRSTILENPVNQHENIQAETDQIKQVYVNEEGYAIFIYTPSGKNPPLEPNARVYIIGELTQGKFMELQKDPADPEDSYMILLKITPGNKYTFCFKVGDIFLTSAYYPTRLSKFGKALNYVYAVDSKTKALQKMVSYIDPRISPIEKNVLEEYYKQVMPPEKVKKLQEEAKDNSAMYYSVEAPWGIYKFSRISDNGDTMLLQRLTDQNFIPLAKHNEVLEEARFEELDIKFVALTELEIYEKTMELKKKKLNVLYQVLGSKECSLVGIDPEGNVKDYDVTFNYDNCKVASVENKIFGDVEWTSEEVDNEYAFLTITPIEVYSQELEPDVYNLLHVHIASIGESATVDLTYIHDDGDLREHYKLEKDITGADLKYKILIQKNAVRSILYNYKGKVKELKFVEHKYAVNDLVNVRGLCIPNVEYARIVSIPVQTMASLDKSKLDKYDLGEPSYKKVSGCKNRFFAELQGYVDLELIPDVPERPKEIMRISAPLCYCLKDPSAETIVNGLLNKWEMAHKNKINILIESIKEKLRSYKEKGAAMSKPEKQEMLRALQESEGELIAVPEEQGKIDPAFVVMVL